MRKFCVVFAGIMLLPGVAMYAAEEMPPKDSLRIYNMDEVVITATRIPQELIHIPQRIAVLPMFRYRMNPVVSAYDILDQVSGVTLNRTMAVFSKKSVVSMRGMGNEQGRTLILIDGVPANKASSGGVNLNRINPNNIERVEIVKGPGSSLYGGNAMGGTINVITRQYKGTIQGSASTLWGERGTFGSGMCVGGSTGDLYYNVNGNYLKSNGFNNSLKEERDETTISSALDQYSVDGKLGYRITPNQKIDVSSSYYDGSRGDGTRYFFTQPGLGQLDLMNRVREQNYKLTYQGDKGSKVWQISGFYNQEKYTEQRAKGSTLYDVESIRRDWGAWANLHLKLGESNLFAIGAEVKGGYVDGRDDYKDSGEQMINRGKSLLMGIWAEDEVVFGNWRIVPALRFDLAHVYDGGFFVEQPGAQTEIYIPYTGPIKSEWWQAVSPKLSAQYLWSANKRIFLNSGLGFRPGTLEDMTRMGPVNGGVIIPNPNLKPEHVFSTEVGGDIGLWNWLTLTSSIYYTYATDFIYNRNTGQTILMGKKERPLLQKTNAGKVGIWGIEADAYVGISDNLNLFTNYAWTKAEMRSEYKGKLLPYVPKNKFALGGSWTNPIVSINMAYVQYGKQYLDDLNTQRMSAYGTVDIKLWHLFNDKIQVSLNGANLFDRRVDENGSLTPGRLIYGEVRVSF